MHGITVPAPTIRRHLRDANLSSKRPATGSLVTKANFVVRLHLAQAHLNWILANWKRVMLTDETRIALFGPDSHRRVWRRSGERWDVL